MQLNTSIANNEYIKYNSDTNQTYQTINTGVDLITTITIDNYSGKTGHISAIAYYFQPPAVGNDLIGFSADSDFTLNPNSIVGSITGRTYYVNSELIGDPSGYYPQIGDYHYSDPAYNDLFALEGSGVVMKINLPASYDNTISFYTESNNEIYYVVTLDADFVIKEKTIPDFTYFNEIYFLSEYVHQFTKLDWDMTTDVSIGIDGPTGGITFSPSINVVTEHKIVTQSFKNN